MGALSRIAATLLTAGGLALAVASPALQACGSDNANPVSSACAPGAPCQVRLTLLHTSDVHSRLIPFDQLITQVDSALGLGQISTITNVGGVARMAYILGRERARADRVLHLDSGDCFQGAPIFNFFSGEPEVRSVAALGTDASVIGNHEFDRGAQNVATQMQKWANFPLLLANYKFETPGVGGDFARLGTVTRPFTVFNREGLKIGVIGMGNLSSLTSIFDQPNRLGITPLKTTEVAQFYIDLIRPYVDVIIMLTHLGLDVDQQMVRGTTGIDLVLGGHNHIVINPPQELSDCSADPQHPGSIWTPDPNVPEDPGMAPPNDANHPDPVNHPYQFLRACKPRKVLITHSGAFAKYVGRLDLVFSNDPALVSPTGNPADYDPINGFEVLSSRYQAFPIESSVPEDPVVKDMLQPYIRTLDRVADLDILVGYSPNGAKRTSTQGGDAALGNLIANAMWLRLGVQTDFSLTNTTGIRTDMNPGPITIEQMYNIFPFDNSITKMQLSGLEVTELFDYVARRSAGRGCTSQAQIAGARVRLNCAGCSRPDAVVACKVDIDCPSGALGACDLTKGTCFIEGCAEQVYIGHVTDAAGNRVKCHNDAECPDKLPGSCDKSAEIALGTTTGIGICLSATKPTNLYELATSNYLAAGGSGFRVLQRNTTQFDTQIQQRDALTDYLRQGKPCGYSTDNLTAEGLKFCANDTDCSADGSTVCACPGHVKEIPGGGSDPSCVQDGACDKSIGRCVRVDCRDTVASFHRKKCADSPTRDACNIDLNACSLAGEECKFLACVDNSLGNFEDRRLEMLGR